MLQCARKFDPRQRLTVLKRIVPDIANRIGKRNTFKVFCAVESVFRDSSYLFALVFFGNLQVRKSLILQSGLIDGYRVFVAGQSVNKSCGRINVSATANAVHKRMLRLVLLAFADGTYLPMLCFIKIIREGMRGFILDFLRVFAGRRMPVVIGVTRPIGSERMSVFPSARRETRNRTYHRR